MDRILKIADLKSAIKKLQMTLDEEINILNGEIELGLLEEFEEEGSIVYGGVRCTPYTTKRWEYNKETKAAIKSLQEISQYNGDATQKTSTSLRITF